jgi:hypothetical protein
MESTLLDDTTYYEVGVGGFGKRFFGPYKTGVACDAIIQQIGEL